MTSYQKGIQNADELRQHLVTVWKDLEAGA